MARRIAIFGGSFNPPGVHHLRVAQQLALLFDEVRIIPCGPRPDKPITGAVPPVYRAALADMTFGGMDRVVVDLFDLEQETFTRNHQLDSRFSADGEVWHVVGTDLVEGGAKGASLIQRTWEKGPQLWKKARFAVLTRAGYEFNPKDLPPHSEVIEINIPGSSTEIRDRLARGKSVADLVTPRSVAYLERYGLYRAPVPGTWSRGSLANTPYALLTNSQIPKAVKVSASLKKHVPMGRAGFISVVGGDGAMLRAIREYWRLRLPFFGINAGHLGFLMNAPEEVKRGPFPSDDVIFRQMPMLYIECTDSTGKVTTTHGFNDAWLERSTSQSAWLEVKVNGVVRIAKLVGDGALVSTAAGSTAYARSMGASPLLADTPAWLVVGSNVMEPAHWRSALLSIDATVEIRNLDPQRRPVEAFVDGETRGQIVSMKARISRAAAAELAFCASHDMAEKIATIQFHRATES